VVIYRVTHPEDVIFRDELEQLARTRGIAMHYVVGSHREPGNEGLMSQQHILELIPDIAEREVYLCGPRAMMRTVEQHVLALGVEEDHIHADEFAF
jgi:ferredoxin-NADP reductase